jgi:glycosyltransferase involved in cell wall biosynthesis
MDKIVVALPAYNEEKYIGIMVTKVKEYADEVLVLNDGSSDKTEALAKEAGAEVISHPKNMGYGATIQSIIKEARKRQFDAFVIMDADTQHSAEDIPDLVKPILEGCDLVIGARRRVDIPQYRYFGGWILSSFVSMLSGRRVMDSQSGFRAFSPRAVKVLDLKENGMAVSSEMTVKAVVSGLKIREVPISIRYTEDSSTHNPVYQGFYTLWRIMARGIRWMKH